jgi:hypothetical protein
MLRPLPRHPSIELEVVDDDVDETSVLARNSSELRGLADVLEPEARISRVEPMVAPPVSVRAPVQVQDFAFADTVIARELPPDEPTPPSGPIFVNDVSGSTQCVTPLAFPLPSAAEDADMETRARVFSAHIRHTVRYSLEEMRELWAGTAEIVDGSPADSPARSAARFFRRVVALWSCWQWERTDVTRAALIGLGVFAVTAAIGATTARPHDRRSADGDSSSASSATEVRATHTLDQHTGRNAAVRTKAIAR